MSKLFNVKLESEIISFLEQEYQVNIKMINIQYHKLKENVTELDNLICPKNLDLSQLAEALQNRFKNIHFNIYEDKNVERFNSNKFIDIYFYQD